MIASRRKYYWLVCRDETGRANLIFGGKNEEEARQKGLELLGGVDFEIREYPTRDLGTASAYYRGTRLERGEGLNRARQRLGHERSLSRLLKRRLKRRKY